MFKKIPLITWVILLGALIVIVSLLITIMRANDYAKNTNNISNTNKSFVIPTLSPDVPIYSLSGTVSAITGDTVKMKASYFGTTKEVIITISPETKIFDYNRGEFNIPRIGEEAKLPVGDRTSIQVGKQIVATSANKLNDVNQFTATQIEVLKDQVEFNNQ